MVRTQLEGADVRTQAAFEDSFRSKRKSLAVAYILSIFFFMHYAYVGRVGMTFLVILASVVTFGFVGFIWWFIDLFRMPGIVRKYNDDAAVSVLRDQMIISGTSQ